MAKKRKPTPKQQQKIDANRVSNAYSRTCNGIQVPMQKIPDIFAAGHAAIAAGADDTVLEQAVRAYVETVRGN